MNQGFVTNFEIHLLNMWEQEQPMSYLAVLMKIALKFKVGENIYVFGFDLIFRW